MEMDKKLPEFIPTPHIYWATAMWNPGQTPVKSVPSLQGLPDAGSRPKPVAAILI